MNLADRIIDWFMDNVMGWFLIIGIVLIAAFVLILPFALYAEYTAEKFSLKKDEWQCTASVERSSTTYVQSGSVLLPITTYSNHCTQWSAKP